MSWFKRCWRSASMLTFAAAAAVTVGCGGSGVGGTQSKALQDAPAGVAAVYRANCISCHGSELQGRVGPQTNLTQVGARMSAEEIAGRIRDGEAEGGMPAFGEKLTAEEIEGLSDWLSGKK